MGMPLAEQFEHLGGSRLGAPASTVRTCRICRCTDADCHGCIERTGMPCSWVEPDLCSACEERSPADIDLHAAAVEAACGFDRGALESLPWTCMDIPKVGIYVVDGQELGIVEVLPPVVDGPAVARLISAAPELLAAAEHALKVIDREACAITYRELQAAVAKARG